MSTPTPTTTTIRTHPLKVALLGSGIFVREQHKPAIDSLPDLLTLVAVYSRTRKSAELLLLSNENDNAYTSSVSDLTKEALSGHPSNDTKNKNRNKIDIYSDDSEGQGLKELLERKDVEVVIIALPITLQPQIIKQCILAGKHVLSEKPIAQTLSSATNLIHWYEQLPATTTTTTASPPIKKPIWSIAENFRFLQAFTYAAHKITTLGNILAFSANMHTFVQQGSKYYETPWRKAPEFQGGFLLDAGVHYAAALQLLLGPHNQIVRLSAFTAQNQSHLRPKDTVSATLKLSTGTVGYYNCSFGSTLRGDEFTIACERGSVTAAPGKVVVRDCELNVVEEREFPEDDGMGVYQEVRAFAEAVMRGVADERQSLRLAWSDLELIEKMLVSGDLDGEPQVVVRFQG